MLLYHYSVDKFKDLRCINLRGKGMAGEKDPWHYGNHISFFLEKIPLDLAKITDNAYSFWKSGKELFEHVVDTNSLPVDIKYHITETPEKTKLLYVTQDWESAKGNPDKIRQFGIDIRSMEVAKRYRGDGRLEFVKQAKKFNHGIKKYYEEAYELALSHPEDDILDKYAACVPHAMLYVGRTTVKVQSVTKITLE